MVLAIQDPHREILTSLMSLLCKKYKNRRKKLSTNTFTNDQTLSKKLFGPVLAHHHYVEDNMKCRFFVKNHKVLFVHLQKT